MRLVSFYEAKGFVQKVTKNGRITIPDRVREICGIEDGDWVEVRVRKLRKEGKKKGGDA